MLIFLVLTICVHVYIFLKERYFKYCFYKYILMIQLRAQTPKVRISKNICYVVDQVDLALVFEHMLTLFEV